MPTCRIINGDALDTLRKLPPESVHCIVTSPPYFGLRSYKTNPKTWSTVNGSCANHLWNESGFCSTCNAWQGELGGEPHPDLFIQHLVQIFAEAKRVLHSSGILWINIGDCYSGSWGNYGSRNGQQRKRSSQLFDRRGWDGRENERPAASKDIGIPAKNLIGIPWKLAFALQQDGWYLRSDCIWSKINPMPSSTVDRPATSHEYFFMFSKSPRYYYDNLAVLEPYTKPLERWGGDKKKTTDNLKDDSPYKGAHRERLMRPNKNGRNRRTIWTTKTSSFKGSHSATFPEELITIPILASTSEHGCCPKCRAPYQRITERKIVETEEGLQGDVVTKGWEMTCKCQQIALQERRIADLEHCTTALSPIPCTVLDVFGGAGTTGLVANKLGRNAILIELSQEYSKLAHARIESEVGGELFMDNKVWVEK